MLPVSFNIKMLNGGKHSQYNYYALCRILIFVRDNAYPPLLETTDIGSWQKQTGKDDSNRVLIVIRYKFGGGEKTIGQSQRKSLRVGNWNSILYLPRKSLFFGRGRMHFSDLFLSIQQLSSRGFSYRLFS